MDCARHIIKRALNPRSLDETTTYDVASTVHQSIAPGELEGDVREVESEDEAARGEVPLARVPQDGPAGRD